MFDERCTCRPGRDYDGSEFGPCPFCEWITDMERNNSLNAELRRRLAVARAALARLESGECVTYSGLGIQNEEYVARRKIAGIALAAIDAPIIGS